MLYAFTHRVDAGVVGLHGVIHHDATLTVQACRLCQRNIRAYADGHHHQCAVDAAAIGKLDAGDVILAEDFGGLGLHQEFHAALFQ